MKKEAFDIYSFEFTTKSENYINFSLYQGIGNLKTFD